MRKSEYALISNLAREKGIKFAYKDKSADKDSGWRFFHVKGDDTPLTRIKRKELLASFPEIEEILSARRGSVYELSRKGWRRISRDNSLSNV